MPSWLIWATMAATTLLPNLSSKDFERLQALTSHSRITLGEVSNAVKAFFRRNGIVVRSTARAMSVIDDVVTGRLRS